MRYGYFEAPNPSTGNLASFQVFKQSVKEFQSMAGLDPTGTYTNIFISVAS